MTIKSKPMIKIKRAKNGQFFFTIQGKNGQVILTSETYKSRAGCRKGINAVLNVCGSGRLIKIKDETDKPPVKRKPKANPRRMIVNGFPYTEIGLA